MYQPYNSFQGDLCKKNPTTMKRSKSLQVCANAENVKLHEAFETVSGAVFKTKVNGTLFLVANPPHKISDRTGDCLPLVQSVLRDQMRIEIFPSSSPRTYYSPYKKE
ncbi:hypothetical protein L228DRAFT_78998 [Xylona heveae TC161]|uniref:Uncharacterized protein n=1 Tax=Xylona heveae (strain CBS 132557 / TC161) TaxID=1328760 RepID=A0A165IYY9_XYLHT|nr:hypothetical protein L228DRAFT_78998 [Xylona heveae TC161]KZF25568.1 hypothetical protein L228DRAFT_78998 [Xylona heveae TC161]